MTQERERERVERERRRQERIDNGMDVDGETAPPAGEDDEEFPTCKPFQRFCSVVFIAMRLLGV